MFYDPKKKIIVDFGSSKPCGNNHNRYSIHAEQSAIQYCLTHDKRQRYHIFISRFTRCGHHKTAHCCHSCSQLAKKYNFENRIFTFNDQLEIIPAIIDNPGVSLAYKIKYNIN